MLRQDGKTQRVLSPTDASLRVHEIATPQRPHDAPNPGVRMIVFEAAIPAGQSARLEVLLAPSKNEPVDAPFAGLREEPTWRRALC